MAILIAAGWVLPVGAESTDMLPGARVEELLDLVKARNPELAAMQQEADAVAARVQPAGALSDPMFRMEWQDIDRNNPNLLPGRVGSVKYTLLQSFPLWGKRGLKREVAEAEASQAGGRRMAVEADLLSRVKIAFAQHYQAFRAAELSQETLQLMRDLERLAQTRYANGLAPQQDVIKAQAEQTALRVELVTLETEQHHTRARLNVLLNRSAHAALAQPRELRSLVTGIDEARLEGRIQQANPVLATQRSQVAAAEAGQRLVKKNRYPDMTLGLSPIQRGSALDAWEVMFEINIPLQQQTRRSQEREAAALASASRLRMEALATRFTGEFQEALVALQAAQRQENIFSNSLLPQTELTYQSALAGYQTGKVDFATLLDAQRQIKKVRLDRLKVRVEAEIRRAEIERLLGEEL